MSPITSHVLDTSLGQPARALPIELARLQPDGTWRVLAEGLTDADGRVRHLMAGAPLETGTYRLRFDTKSYFAATARDSLYPHVDVTFAVRDAAEHYHVPLLLSPFGYSTYRGS
jgi:5-hydroxyisourate hydrolase